jgi:hypothetical protein
MNRINRRSFLRTAFAAAAGASLPPAARAQKPEPFSPRPCPPSAWEKHGILLEATEPWESDSIQNFTTTVEPLKGEAWRIWYSASGDRRSYGLAYAEGVPGRAWKKTPATCSPGHPADTPFAIGNLPEDWRPVQVTHIRLQNGRHRIYFWVHGPRVARYLAAESDDGRR